MLNKKRFINNLDFYSRSAIYHNMCDIEKAEYLSSEVADGNVLRCPFKGNLEKDGYEIGALVMEPDSVIYDHKHENYIETYSKISNSADVTFGFRDRIFNFCNIDSIHSASNLSGTDYACIIYTKIKV